MNFFSKAAISLVLSVSSAPAFGGAAGCAPWLFFKQIAGLGRSHSAGAAAPRFYSLDGQFWPRGLGASKHQQLVMGGEDVYFILDGKVAKKSLLSDEWRFLDGLDGARAILPQPREGSLLALTKSREVYQLKEDGAGGHEWSLYHKPGVIKMFYNQSGELIFLLGTDKEMASLLAANN